MASEEAPVEAEAASSEPIPQAQPPPDPVEPQAEAPAPSPPPPPAADAVPPPPSTEPPAVAAPAPIADQNQLIKDIFGDSEDEEPLSPKTNEEANAAEKRSKSDGKKSKRQRSEEKAAKKQRKGEKESRKKKRSDDDDDDGVAPAAAGGDASDEEKFTGKHRKPKEQSHFDRVLESLKRTGRRKRTDAADEAARQEVSTLLVKMQNAAQSDLEAFAKEQPATHKLKLLGEVLTAVGKAHLQPFFVPEILPVITTWLTPTPDGTLPNLSVRDGMLTILKQLPNIDTESLKSSGVGRAVMAIFKHPEEHSKNKKVAQELIERWSRPLFQLQDSYRDLREDDRDAPPPSRPRLVVNPEPVEASPLDKYVQEKKNAKPRMRAQIPNRDPLDFTKQPRSYKELQSEQVELPALPPSLQFKASKSKLGDKFTSKGSSKAAHFVKMSVEGRGFGN